MELLHWCKRFWDHTLSPNWSIIIPVLFILIGVTWWLMVYRKGNFRFLPALAIARVTILDSIGRLEVIILLAIGVLVIGINGIVPNLPEGRANLERMMETEFFQQQLDEMSGFSNVEDYESRYLVPPDSSVVSDEGLNLSTVDGEILMDPDSESHPVSTVGIEPAITPEDDEPDAMPVNTGVAAEELAAIERENQLNSLIWQGAFLIADFFVALIGFVLAMVVLPNEINRGIILSILPKPLSRDEYVVGKAIGIWAIVTGCFLIFSIELFGIHMIIDALSGEPPWDPNYLKAMLLFPIKYASLILIIMGLTLRMPEVPAGIIGVTIFMCGHFADKINEIADSMPVIYKILIKIGYWAIPHLSQVTFTVLDQNESLLFTWGRIWGWVWQVGIYNLVMLWLLTWLFRRRSL